MSVEVVFVAGVRRERGGADAGDVLASPSRLAFLPRPNSRPAAVETLLLSHNSGAPSLSGRWQRRLVPRCHLHHRRRPAVNKRHEQQIFSWRHRENTVCLPLP